MGRRGRLWGAGVWGEGGASCARPGAGAGANRYVDLGDSCHCMGRSRDCVLSDRFPENSQQATALLYRGSSLRHRGSRTLRSVASGIAEACVRDGHSCTRIWRIVLTWFVTGQKQLYVELFRAVGSKSPSMEKEVLMSTGA
jgi:hypothetical protein